MILTCTSCGTRYSVDGSKFPAAGRTVRCAKCGHSWHQAAEAAEPLPEPPAPAFDGTPETPVPEPADGGFSPTRDFAPPSVVPEPSAPLAPKLAIIAGWIGLFVVVLLIAFAAVKYRQHIASIWPQSAGVYNGIGLPVNASGLDFRKVGYRRETEDGQIVLAVSGEIVNTSSRQLPVPQTVRITLSGADKRELYHWTLKPSVTVLAPGQSVPFLTRLASPPSAARILDVSFSKDGS
ncbi:MAG TPA: zinc-ribbon domain-containing protein [Rhizomicrobium sp.]|nr:zinc-ribbon domain-containing protein [Rhizomicrobium sp.]